MSNLPYLTPFDILVKNFFDSKVDFLPAVDAKPHHPVDIFEDKEGLHLEIACTGIDKKDIEILIEGQMVRIKYIKPEDSNSDKDNTHYYLRGISRRSFNLGYKVASRFDTSLADAKFVNGLLAIDIPFAEESKPKSLKIK